MFAAAALAAATSSTGSPPSTSSAAGASAVSPNMFPAAASLGGADLFSLAAESTADDSMFGRTSPSSPIESRAAAARRKKRASLFDDDEDDGEIAPSSGGSPGASAAAAALDDLELEKVLASFSPEPESSPVFGLAQSDDEFGEDDFDRWMEGVGGTLFAGVDSVTATTKQQQLAAANSAQNYARLFADEPSSTSSRPDTTVFFSPGFSSHGVGRAASIATPSRTRSTSTEQASAPTTHTPAPESTVAAGAGPSSNASAPPPSTPGPASSSSGEPRDALYAEWQRQYLLDQQVQERIDRTWLSSGGSEEATARAKFLKAFSGLEKKPATLLRATRNFVDSFAAYVRAKRLAKLRTEIVDTAALLDGETFDSTFHARVERSAEVAILLPVWPRLVAVCTTQEAANDELVREQSKRLLGRDQAHFGIPAQHRSASAWRHARHELAQLQKFDLPADKVQVLLGTAKAIYQTYQHEAKLKIEAAEAEALAAGLPAPASAPTSSLYLPADDFFPIWVFVVSQTALAAPCTLKALMWALCDPKALSGAEGYYLTTFDAAVEYIRTANVDQPMNVDQKRT